MASNKRSERRSFDRKVKYRVDRSLILINSTACSTVGTVRTDVEAPNLYDLNFDLCNGESIGNVITKDLAKDVSDQSSIGTISEEYPIINNVCSDLIFNSDSNQKIPSTQSLELPINFSNTLTLSQRLAKWTVDENIPLSCVGKLLKILREDPVCKQTNLPVDPRTLLRTPVKSFSKKLGDGSFYYFGISQNLNNLCIKYNVNVNSSSNFFLAVNMDGLPLSKSSNSSFWPILGSVKSIPVLKNKVFLIGLFYGCKKPDCKEFLQDFVNECIELTLNGVAIKSTKCNFKIDMLICDTPAKSYILNIKSHTGYYSCTKCFQKGKFVNNILCFPTVTFDKRNDASFRSKLQSAHHSGKTILENIPNFDIISNVPLDYMHLLLLGVTKRLLCSKKFGWVYGKPPHKLRASKIINMSDRLIALKKFIPCEFARKTRSLLECKRYKATEFRLFLLYTGPIVLKDALDYKVYINFISLSVASMILISSNYSQQEEYRTFAEDILKHFVLNSIKIYGHDFVSHNVHNLLHLVDCVRNFGSLDNFSSFEFENYMQFLLKKIHKYDKPLEQVIRRVTEENKILESLPNFNECNSQWFIEHNEGPLLNNCHPPQFRKFKTKDFSLNVARVADRFVELHDSTIVDIRNFACRNNTYVLIGYRYKRFQDFFTKPCPSSVLDINCVKKENDFLESWNFKDIKRKVVVLPFKNYFVMFPLLHV